MAKYISTGKMNFPRTILGLAFGIVSALMLGIVYGWAMDLIPFIIVDAIVFVGTIILMVAISVGIVRIGVIRNNAVKIICILIVCFVAWYSQWVYTTQNNFWTSLLRFGRVFGDILDWSDSHELSISRGFSSHGSGISGMGLLIVYGIEFLLFLSPVILVFKFASDYFCENCGKFNKSEEFYVRELDENKITSSEDSGDFRFIAQLKSSKSVPGYLGIAWQIEFAHCETCMQTGVINIWQGQVEFDKKNKLMFDNSGSITRHTLLSAASVSDLAEMKHE